MALCYSMLMMQWNQVRRGQAACYASGSFWHLVAWFYYKVETLVQLVCWQWIFGPWRQLSLFGLAAGLSSSVAQVRHNAGSEQWWLKGSLWHIQCITWLEEVSSVSISSGVFEFLTYNENVIEWPIFLLVMPSLWLGLGLHLSYTSPIRCWQILLDVIVGVSLLRSILV